MTLYNRKGRPLKDGQPIPAARRVHICEDDEDDEDDTPTVPRRQPYMADDGRGNPIVSKLCKSAAPRES